MLEKNKIIFGDCLETMKKLPDNCIDLILTDPPYEIGYADWDSSLNWDDLFQEFDRISKDNANIIIFQGWTNVCNTISKIPKTMTLKNWIAWDRIKGRGAKTQLVSTKEEILWIVKNEDNYVFNKIPSNIKKKTGGMGKKNGCEYRALSNVWTDISPIVPWSKEKVKHPTQKPIALMERCIKIWSKENDFVLDCFSGSGTTAIACKNLKRDFLGIENNFEYFTMSIERLKEKKGE